MDRKKNIAKNEVYQSNALIEATYNISLNGLKLLRLLASMIKKDDEDFKEYSFKISILLELFEVKNQSQYIEIPKTTKELMSKVVVISYDKGFYQYPLLSMAKHDIGSGEISIKIHPDLKPFFFDLSGNYTKYELENILKLRSTYSIQLYELMKMNHYKGKVTYSVEELRRITCANTKAYERYNNFKNRVIRIAQNELGEKTDISFEFEEIKTGRKVTSLKFYIESNVNKSKNNIKELALTIEADEVDLVIEEVRNIMNEHEFTEKEIKVILKSANGDIERIRQVYNHFKNKRAANFIGLMVSMVKPEGFAEPQDNNSTEYADDRGYDYEEFEKKIEEKQWAK